MVPELSPVIRFRRKLHWKAAYWWYSPLVAQWLGLMVFSTIQFNRFALTHDFAFYWQAVWLIAHGHWNPYSTVTNYPFLDNHFELIMYLLAPLVAVAPTALSLLFIQNLSLVGAELIAWQWIQSYVMRIHHRWSAWIRLTSLALLILNPWTYWAAAFDFHIESLIVSAITLGAYALWRNRRRKHNATPRRESRRGRGGVGETSVLRSNS